MRTFTLLLSAGLLHAQPSVTLHPPVITDCDSAGLGQATVQWSDPGGGLVQVLVGTAGVSFTGRVPASGSSTTGVWVSDGLPFVLVDAAGNQLANTTAQVLCSPSGGPVAAGLAAASYLPLDIGNRWIYLTNSRLATAQYVQWLVTGAQTVGGQLWFVIQVSSSGMQSTSSASFQMLMRQDSGGRIYTLQNGQAALWLDPNTPQDPTAQLQVVGRGPQQNPLGAFADGLNYSDFNVLTLETGTLVRGLGLTSSSTNMLTGSSGGFVQSMDLVEARIDGHLLFAIPVSSLQLSMEAAALDPPGTYKPCFKAGVKLGAEASTASVDLSVLDASGNVLAQTTMSLIPDDGGRTEGYYQMPLYTAPNQPFAPGNYRLSATSGGSSAVLAFQVQ
jgi:hypothetical protein